MPQFVLINVLIWDSGDVSGTSHDTIFLFDWVLQKYL